MEMATAGRYLFSRPWVHSGRGEEEPRVVGEAGCEVGLWEGSRARMLRADSCIPGGEDRE